MSKQEVIVANHPDTTGEYEHWYDVYKYYGYDKASTASRKGADDTVGVVWEKIIKFHKRWIRNDDTLWTNEKYNEIPAVPHVPHKINGEA